MRIFYNKTELSGYIGIKKAENITFGFVPTMGALHMGHMSLVNKGLVDNDLVVVSIFVNPTQFNNKEDLKKYPRTLDKDIEILKEVSLDKIIVYAPEVKDIYEDDIRAEHFNFGGIENEMEGAFRPGHFDGVGTIVKRFLEIVKPNMAYFGEKDFQQLQIIRKLTELYGIPVKIVGCPIHRAEDGLAMSSRNQRLKPEYRKAAPFIYETLKAAKIKFGTKSANQISEWVDKQFEKHPLLELEYFLIADVDTLKPLKRKSKQKTYRAFIAVYADDIRLIDNIALN